MFLECCKGMLLIYDLDLHTPAIDVADEIYRATSHLQVIFSIVLFILA